MVLSEGSHPVEANDNTAGDDSVIGAEQELRNNFSEVIVAVKGFT